MGKEFTAKNPDLYNSFFYKYDRLIFSSQFTLLYVASSLKIQIALSSVISLAGDLLIELSTSENYNKTAKFKVLTVLREP